MLNSISDSDVNSADRERVISAKQSRSRFRNSTFEESKTATFRHSKLHRTELVPLMYYRKLVPACTRYIRTSARCTIVPVPEPHQYTNSILVRWSPKLLHLTLSPKRMDATLRTGECFAARARSLFYLAQSFIPPEASVIYSTSDIRSFIHLDGRSFSG